MGKDRSKPEFRRKVYDKFKGFCAYCGEGIAFEKFDIDHIIPLKRHETDRDKKGASKITNYFPACGSCNSSKNTMSVDVWRSEIEKKLARLRRDSSTYRLCLRFGLIEEKPTAIVFHFEKGVKNG